MKTKETLKTCKNGHKFHKTSDCPTCPTCEEGRKPKDSFLASLGAPARRALENNGISTLEQLSNFSEREVLQFHGMGKSTIPKLRKLLSENDLIFRLSPSQEINTKKEMENRLPIMNDEVTRFVAALDHPFRTEIEMLRTCILSANNDLTENIKWNGPNYSIDSEDRITMRIQPPTKQVQLIFHRGAKKQEQPTQRLIANGGKMLVWKENDRAIATFKSLQEIENGKAELTTIVNEWIIAAK